MRLEHDLSPLFVDGITFFVDKYTILNVKRVINEC